MSDKITSFIVEFIPFMALAVLGGISNLIIQSSEDNADYTLKFIIGEIFLAMFTSILVVFTMKEFGAGDYQIGIAC